MDEDDDDARGAGTVVATTEDGDDAEAVDLVWMTDAGGVTVVARSSVVAVVELVGTTDVSGTVAGGVDEVVTSVVGTNTAAGVVRTELAAPRATPPATRTKAIAIAVTMARRTGRPLFWVVSSLCAPVGTGRTWT